MPLDYKPLPGSRFRGWEVITEPEDNNEGHSSGWLPWASVTSQSGWVVECAYDLAEGELHVKFKDGAICIYTVPQSYYDGLRSGGGRFVHSNLYHLHYRQG